MTRHLLVDISGHGFGHLGQTAPVVNALTSSLSGLRVTVRSKLPPAVIRSRIPHANEIHDIDVDVGMCMASAVDVLPEASHMAYLRFHENWNGRVTDQAKVLERLAPDLILSNCPYLVIAAARTIGASAVALSSLNWAEVYRRYCSTFSGFAAIHEQIMSGYGAATAFLTPEPSLPMKSLSNVHRIGPVALRGRYRRAEIDAACGFSSRERVVLVDAGGIPTAMSLKKWPSLPNVRWLAPEKIARGCPQAVPLEEFDLPFIDILASSDALITKPGYGMFVEAACHRIAVLYGGRSDWPEEPHLSNWLKRHAAAVGVQWHRILTGDIAAPLELLLASPRLPAAAPLGVAEAAKYLRPLLL